MLGLEKGFSPDTIDLLEDMGHKIEIQQTMGSTQSILWRDGKFYGAADPRRPNALAIGLARPPQVRSATAAAN
jgi:gamma-glutamyltranspeptidase/glutathione hydrolase